MKPQKHCSKCGLPLGFKKLKSGKWCPTNPDGSDHWDLCRATWLANMTPAQHAKQKEKDRIMGLPVRTLGKTVTHVYSGTIPPWDESLGPIRDFTPEEKAAGIICTPVKDPHKAIRI